MKEYIVFRREFIDHRAKILHVALDQCFKLQFSLIVDFMTILLVGK